MRYGIKHSNGIIQSISSFEGDLDLRFTEITKAKYDEFIAALDANPFSSYDAINNEISGDAVALAAYQLDVEKQNKRTQLRLLSIELDLMARLSEDKTSTQSDFDALMADYQS